MRAAGYMVALSGVLAAGCGGGSGGGVLPPPATTVLDVHAQVFGPRCALSGCHTGPTPPKGLDLSTVQSAAANLVGVASVEQPGLLRVDPFDAAGSYLFMKINGDPGILGDRMPLDNPPLGAADIALIRTWIEQGAQ